MKDQIVFNKWKLNINMKIKIIPEVGDIITVKSFSFNNVYGGTGMSNWDYDEKFTFPATIKVIKEWEDDECGQRGWGIAVPTDKKLIEYLRRNAKPGHYGEDRDMNWVDKHDYFILYWSEFEIAEEFFEKLNLNK